MLLMNEAVSVPDSLADVLAWESQALAHIATLGPDGGPHSSPVWFHWEDNQLTVSVYESSQKMRNLKRDPRLSVSIVDPANAYRYVEIRGVAVSFEPDPSLEFLTKMADKYLGLDHYPWHEEGQVEVTVTINPTRITGMGS
jgi:PPOX class probable F420-dependent enzyme